MTVAVWFAGRRRPQQGGSQIILRIFSIDDTPLAKEQILVVWTTGRLIVAEILYALVLVSRNIWNNANKVKTSSANDAIKKEFKTNKMRPKSNDLYQFH